VYRRGGWVPTRTRTALLLTTPLHSVTQTLFLSGFVPHVLQVNGLIFSGHGVGYVSFRSAFLELLTSRGVPIVHLVLTGSPVFAGHTVYCTVDARYSTPLEPSFFHPCALYRTYLWCNFILFLNLQIDQFPEIESFGTIFSGSRLVIDSLSPTFN